jgi:uncharacterized membrane protein
MDRTADLLRRSRLLAAVALVGTVALLALLIAVPFVVPHENLPASLLVFWGAFILIVALILGISAAYVLLTKARPGEGESMATDGREPPSVAGPTAEEPFPEASALILQLLDGDERRMYRIVVQSGGRILQGELVRLTSFSDAKVSRLLDRLEDRGVLVRERHGMTNRVRLSDGWREKR